MAAIIAKKPWVRSEAGAGFFFIGSLLACCSMLGENALD
jgi:hypothetical protein